MTAEERFPAGGAIDGDAILSSDVYRALCAELDETRELLRCHVQDYGDDDCVYPGLMPGGRPTLLTHPLQVKDPDGTLRTCTVAERVVELIEQGAYAERAARSCGVSPATFYSWLDQGGKVKLLLGQNPRARLTRAQGRHLEFLEAVEAAEFVYEMTALQALERIALGTVTMEQITETFVMDDQGEPQLKERKIRRANALPSAAAIQWKLTRRFPERYQLADPGLNDTQPDMTADNVNRLVADVQAYVQQMTPKG